jgi:hypothetical protein
VAVKCTTLSLGAEGQRYLEAGAWQGSIAYRWLRSDRHFRGRHEERHRLDEGSEVINDTHTIDVTVSYAVTDRLNLSFTLPFWHADRSSLYEHTRVSRHTTSAGGLGDARLTGNLWLFKPENHPNGNIALGLGVKAPTGDYAAADYFTRLDPQGNEIRVLRPVDQSIQPGDGGWGILLEMQAFQKLFKNTFAYANGTYLINPREMTRTETQLSTPSNINYLSVPDAYLARAGISYAVWPEQGLALSLGGRIEGVPPRDLIGGSQGFRRPGYAISIEPGVTWAKGRNIFTLNTPVALERNRQRSVPDRAAGRHGDAAFADFFIQASYTRRF